MPSRRRSRRSPQFSGYNFLSPRTTLAPKRKLLKRPQKLRLVRRYIRDLKPSERQSSFPVLHVPGRIGKPIRNPSKPFGYGHHDVVADKKGPIKQPAEINSIPNPIPDTAPTPVSSGFVAAGSPLLGAIRHTSTFGLIIPPTPPPSLPFSNTPPGSFSALPPLPSLIPSVNSALLIDTLFPSAAIEPNLPKSPNVNPQATTSSVHSINVAVIILLAVGSALLLLGSWVLIKICTRTRRRDLPKPSLPIFEDADPEDDFFEAKESPIFGGKERHSPMPGPDGTGATRTWIQYPHARLTQSAVGAQSGGLRTGSNLTQPEVGHVHMDTPNGPPFDATTPSHNTLRRQSMGATSVYSPRSCAYIAQAITHDRLATANGDEALTQSKSRNIPKRRSQLLRDEKQRHRDSASTIGLAYDGECVGSPSIFENTPADTSVIGHREGRERIKSTYLGPGYPIAPNGATYSIATATRVNVGQRSSSGKDKFALRTSSSKWPKDTQALTYALGLATPQTNYLAQSPQPTLYPEDSMGVVDIKAQKKRGPIDRKMSASVPDIPVITPDKLPQNSGLMNMDFRVSQMSLSQLTLEDGGWSPTETASPGLPKDRLMLAAPSSSNTGFDLAESPDSADIPPRVPSPPPLPSLSQMALAQHNSEAYANYRSPTYSLYGLYESGDRRSMRR